MSAEPQSFFNLTSGDVIRDVNLRQPFFKSPEQHAVSTNWRDLDDRILSRTNILDVFANRIPVIRDRNFLSPEDRAKMLEIIKSHELGHYDEEWTWPRLCSVGITHYDHISDKDAYFRKAYDAYALQRRWKEEAGIDILQRVIDRIQTTTNIPVKVATEDDQLYFAGILRAAQKGINIHADYAPYEAPGWSIQRIVAQATFNVLLNEVPGGDTIIYDRQWIAPDDDVNWRKPYPKDTYFPQMLEGKITKVMKAVPGDLTLFNPRYDTLTRLSFSADRRRNFHKVEACDTSVHQPEPAHRFTFGTFMGYLPGANGEPDSIVLWM